jgi:hypothetical protein
MIKEWNNKIYQARYRLINKITRDCKKPQKKFISDITLGIIKSGSVVIQQISRSLEEKIALEKVSERLRAHLAEDNFESVQQTLFDMQCAKLKPDSYIIIDESSIFKPYAGKMEGISMVWDSSKKKAVPGYKLINIMGCVPDKDDYTLVPISSELHSEEEEDTRSQKTIDKINETTIKTDNKCIYVMDRGYDSRQYLEALSYINENQYVVRLCKTRGFRDVDDSTQKSFLDMCKTVKLKHEIKTDEDEEFICGTKTVEIRIDPTPRKNAIFQKSTLVVCRYKNPSKGKSKDKAENGGFFYFLCNYHDDQLSSYEVIKKTLTAYRFRWKIEEAHRQIKQDYGWENLRLRKLRALKNLNLMVWTVICLLFSLDEYRIEMSYIYTNQMTSRASDLKKNLKKFIYYKLNLVLTWVFRNVTKYNIITYCKPKQTEQMTINFNLL